MLYCNTIGTVVAISSIAFFPLVSKCDETTKTISTTFGKTVDLKLLSRGESKWFECAEGYSVIKTSDRYEYAVQSDDGGIEGSGVLAMNSPIFEFPKGIRPTAEFMKSRMREGSNIKSPPSPLPVVVEQSGGKLELYFKGVATTNWYEDKAGRTIVQVTGRYEYAIRDHQGRLMGCGIEVGSMNPNEIGLTPGIAPK